VRSRYVWVVFVALAVFGLVGSAGQGAVPLVVVFHQEGCPDCAFMQAILDKLATEYPNLTIAYHETSEPGSPELLLLLSQRYGITPGAVPVVFVGDKAPIIGAGRAQELALREAVEACLRAECPSPMARATGPAIPWRELLLAGGLVVCFLILYLLRSGI